MPNIAAGQTGTYTLTGAQTLSFTLDPSEALIYNVTRSGVTIANGRATNGRVIGPYLAGDVASITAQRGDVDYTVANYTNPNLSAADVAAVQALVSGGGIPILNGATAGQDSGWIAYQPGRRLAYALDSGTTSTTFSVDISADGSVSLGQAFTGTWASSTVSEISPPIWLTNPLAKFIRFNVLTGGPLSVNLF